MQDDALAASHFSDAGVLIETRMQAVLKEVADSGLLDAAGLYDCHIQLFRDRMLRKLHAAIEEEKKVFC